jgi:hypothetical protein
MKGESKKEGMRKRKELVQNVSRDGRWNMKHSGAITAVREVVMANRM